MLHGLVTICHKARKGRYAGSHWPAQRRASFLLNGWSSRGRFPQFEGVVRYCRGQSAAPHSRLPITGYDGPTHQGSGHCVARVRVHSISSRTVAPSRLPNCHSNTRTASGLDQGTAVHADGAPNESRSPADHLSKLQFRRCRVNALTLIHQNQQRRYACPHAAGGGGTDKTITHPIVDAYRVGSFTSASAKPFFLSTQLSHRPQDRPSGSGS